MLKSLLYVVIVHMALEISCIFKAILLLMTCVLLHFYSSFASGKEAAETPQPVDLHRATIFLGIQTVRRMKGIQEGQAKNEDCSQILNL